ncbi:hypothetical protein LCGC14_1193310 [marine sediment metagenome]|uniref:Uncharacterized protein n=1 Tax=marine sediment metagenome TaxID=412755 RepID=A0A0F9LNF1_9ZZZZ
MEYNYYVYKKPEINLIINKMPIWFREKEFTENENNSSLVLHSENSYDEIWGPISKMEVTWEKKEKRNLFYYKEVEATIQTYNSIGFIVTEKERGWLMSHEFTHWYGHRHKMIRKRFYLEKVIHGIFYCEVSERLFHIHTSIIESMYENYKPYILKSYSSLICH